MLPDAAQTAFRPPHPQNADLQQYARWERVPVPSPSRSPSRSPARAPPRRPGIVARLAALIAARRTAMPRDDRFLLDTLADRRAPGRP